MIGQADNYAQSPAADEPEGVTYAEFERRLNLEMDWQVSRHSKQAAREAMDRSKWGLKGAPFPVISDTEGATELPADAANYDREDRNARTVGLYERRRASDYVEHAINLAGYALDSATFEASKARRWQRYQDTIDLANALEAAGLRANYSGQLDRPAPFIVCPISRTAIRLPVIRRVNFFPEQAASRRAPMLKEVEHYLNQNPWARMSTFTSGTRVPTSGIRERHSAMTRRISRMIAEPWFKARAEMVFRGSEFGTPKLCAKTCLWTWHVHAHTIIRPHRPFPKKWWIKFLRRVGRFMGTHWDAGRPVENARELVKYPVKPVDLKTLLEVGGPAEVRAFFEATLKLRLTETFGTLRAQRSGLRRLKRKRVKERNTEGAWLPAIRQNWNQRGRAVRRCEETAARKLAAAKKKFREGMQMIAGKCELPHPDASPARMTNRIVARLAPAPYSCRVYEPAAFVWNFNGDFDAIANHPSFAPAVSAVRNHVEFVMALASESDAKRQRSTHQSPNCPEGSLVFPPDLPPPRSFRRHEAAIST